MGTNQNDAWTLVNAFRERDEAALQENFPQHYICSNPTNHRKLQRHDEHKPSVVEVFGKRYPVRDNDGNVAFLGRTTVATLRDNECELFDRLCDGEPRHGDERAAAIYSLLYALVVFLGCVSWFGVNAWRTGYMPFFPSLPAMSAAVVGVCVAFTAALMVPIVTHIAFSTIRSAIRSVRLHYVIIFRIGRQRGYELLRELTHAGDEYVAKRAAEALRIVSRYA